MSLNVLLAAGACDGSMGDADGESKAASADLCHEVPRARRHDVDVALFKREATSSRGGKGQVPVDPELNAAL
eukprot:1212975-Lingulodinium_polyedra.AAC.1